MVYTARQAEALGELLPDVTVRYAMTYGNPGVDDVLAELKSQGIGNLLVVPLYPQYAASSTGAALDKVFLQLLRQRNQLSIRTISRFYDDAGYIEAMKKQIQAYWAEHGRGEKTDAEFSRHTAETVRRGRPLSRRMPPYRQTACRSLGTD